MTPPATIRVLDAGSCPSVQAATAALAAYHATAWLAYLGGPGAWSGDASWLQPEGIDAYRKAGIPLLPVWVLSPGGAGSSAECVAALRSNGFSDCTVVLDAETYGVVPGGAALVSGLKTAGYRPVVYCSGGSERRWASLQPVARPEIWIAAWIGAVPENGPELADAPFPGAVGWQFSDQGHTASGPCDVSVALRALLPVPEPHEAPTATTTATPDPPADQAATVAREDLGMVLIASTTPGQPIFLVVAGHVIAVQGTDDYLALAKAGVPTIYLPGLTYQDIAMMADNPTPNSTTTVDPTASLATS